MFKFIVVTSTNTELENSGFNLTSYQYSHIVTEFLHIVTEFLLVKFGEHSRS